MTNDPLPVKIERFTRFLDEQLSKKGWTDYKLAKCASISPSVLSRARVGVLPKWEACEKIASALDMPIDMVFRAAGLLPLLNEETEEIRWVSSVYSCLDDDDRQDVRALIESKISRKKKRV